jgi:glycosyltransferase involved in cell wall biosynthesis
VNIAFDAGAIEIGKGSGVGNYTANQFRRLVALYPEHEFFYFNTVAESALTDPMLADNMHRRFFYPGKFALLRQLDGEFDAVMGRLVQNFISQNKIDVFYITAPFLTSSDIGFNFIYKKEWFNGIRVVATVYDIIPYIYKKQYLRDKATYAWYMRCIEALRFADRLLVISNSVKDDMVKYFHFDPDKIDIIYGGVSDKYRTLPISPAKRNAIFSKWGINRDFILCCVSADWRKNTDGVIAAYALLPETLRRQYQMVIAGRLADREKHEKALKRHRLEGQVILTDYIPDDETLIYLYNLAHYMIIPSFYEGFGLPVLEAWACGKAVLASNNSSLGEIVGEAGLLFDPTNTKGMAKAMEEALTRTTLEDLVAKGKEKLAFYTWDNTAKLTMEALNKLTPVNKQPLKLACVFFPKENYTPSWQAFLDCLKEFCHINVFTEDIPETGYDKILYFVPPNYPASFTEGIIVCTDSAMRKLLQTVTGITDDEGLGVYLKGYLKNNTAQVDFERVITADINHKKDLQTPARLGRIHCVNPMNGYFSHISNYAREQIGLMFTRNFIAAVADAPAIKNTEDKIRMLKNHTDTVQEAQKITTTVSYALGTESARYKLTRASFGSRPLYKIAMVTSWNTRCGIAEYTRYLIEHAEGKEHYQIQYDVWPNKIDENVIDDERVAGRTWEYKGYVTDLADGLCRTAPDIVHIQYTEGFFTPQALSYLIKRVSAEVIITCHNTRHLNPTPEQVALLNRACFVVHHLSDVKQLEAIGIKSTQILHIPHGQISVPPREKQEVQKALQIKDAYPIIGNFGFLLPHKGVKEIIEAVNRLKKKYPRILFIACCALHTHESSQICADEYRKLIDKLNLQNHVRLVTEFLPPDEALYLLQACDLFALPYGETTESASGAVRFCIAARRPLLLTRQPIFTGLLESSVQIKSKSPDDIAAGIEKLLKPNVYEKCMAAVTAEAEINKWEDIATEYIDLYIKKKTINRHQKRYGINESSEARGLLLSSLARKQDLIVFDRWVNELSLNKEPDIYNRKCWEWVYIVQALYERGMLAPGKHGLGFAVGCEPLPSLFAKYGVRITATDLPGESGQAWTGGNQNASSLGELYRPDICDRKTFFKNVQFIPMDMNHIPPMKDIDFCWSSCAFEHIGSKEDAVNFIVNSLQMLNPGGVSVHTTEYNLSGGSADTYWGHVFGHDFLEELNKKITAMGHYFFPLDYRLGTDTDDNRIHKWEGNAPHFKLILQDSIATSMGILIVRAP